MPILRGRGAGEPGVVQPDREGDQERIEGATWAKLSRVGQFNFVSIIRLRQGAHPAGAEAEMIAAIAGPGREMKIDLKAYRLRSRNR